MNDYRYKDDPESPDKYKDVDETPAEPVEEDVDETLSAESVDNVGEDELKHVDNSGTVIGRRNKDLPTEVRR